MFEDKNSDSSSSKSAISDDQLLSNKNDIMERPTSNPFEGEKISEEIKTEELLNLYQGNTRNKLCSYFRLPYYQSFYRCLIQSYVLVTRMILDRNTQSQRLDTLEEVSEPASSEYWQLDSIGSKESTNVTTIATTGNEHRISDAAL